MPEAKKLAPVRIVLILGDQLTPTIAALRAAAPARDVVLLAEVAQEASYVPHHKKKIAFVFSMYPAVRRAHAAHVPKAL